MDRQRRAEVLIPNRPQSVEPHSFYGRGKADLFPTTGAAPSPPVASAWLPRARTPAINIPTHHRTHSNPASRPTMASRAGDKGDDPGDHDQWKVRIHRDAVARFHQMAREAEVELQARLARALDSESRRTLKAEHQKTMDALAKAMEEEEAFRVREEETKRGKRKERRIVIEDDDEEEEWLWRPEGDAADDKKMKSERWRAAVLNEQQAIWDAIKRSPQTQTHHPHSSSSGSAAPAVRARANSTVSGTSPSDGGIRDQSQQRKVRWASNLGATKPATLPNPPPPPTQTATVAKDSMFHERWIPSVSEYAADMREQAARAKVSSSPRDILRSAASANGDAASDSGSSAGVGSWRDWHIRRTQTPAVAAGVGATPPTLRVQTPTIRTQTPAPMQRVQTPVLRTSSPVVKRTQTPVLVPSSPVQRRHTPAPPSPILKRSQTPAGISMQRSQTPGVPRAQTPGVSMHRSQTPSVPHRTQTPSVPVQRAQTPAVSSAPTPATSYRPMRSQTPAVVSSSQRSHSPMLSAKQRSQTPGPERASSPRMWQRAISEATEGGGRRVTGSYEQQLEDMAARLRRELAIPTAS